MKKTSIRNQEALDYTLYMIAGSYFRKAICDSSKHQEKKLLLYYKEESRESQYLMENYVIAFMESYLLNALPERIWQEEVKVSFLKGTKGDNRILFQGEVFKMVIQAKIVNKKSVTIEGRFTGLSSDRKWRIRILPRGGRKKNLRKAY